MLKNYILSFKESEPADKAYLVIVALIRVSLLFAAAKAVYVQDWTVLFVSAATFLLTFSIKMLEKRYKIDFPIEFEIITIVFIYASLFLGEVQNYFTRFWWWDVILHAGSAISIGFIGFTILFVLYKGNEINAHPLLISLFSFLFALGIGAVWEIYEFGMDQLFDMNMQRSGLIDTMWDLIVDAAGALLTSISGYFYLTKKSNPLFKRMLGKLFKSNPNLIGKDPEL